MPRKSIVPLIALGFLATSRAEGIPAESQQVVPDIDPVRSYVDYATMDLDDADGELELYSFDFRAILSKPLSPIEGLTIVPFIQYDATVMNFKGQADGFAFDDEDLHSIALQAFAVYQQKGSPWLFGGWTRAQLATDFQHVDGDDVTFDVIAGAAYTFSDRFLLGFGGAVTNINGDVSFIPGIAFDWKPTDSTRVGLYGPKFIASWTPDNNWDLSFRATANGEAWNITDGAGDSRTVNLDSYRVGLHADRRLGGTLWLRAGAGLTIANELELTTKSGSRIAKEELEQGFFGEIALTLKTW